MKYVLFFAHAESRTGDKVNKFLQPFMEFGNVFSSTKFLYGKDTFKESFQKYPEG